jgi:hypothetical protein
VEDARRAIELDPDLIGARMALAGAYQSRATRLETQDRDATQATRAAIRVLEGLVARHPLFVPARSDLGAAWARRAYALEDRGEEPEEAYRHAVHQYREAVRLAPSLAKTHGRLGLTLSAFGERLQRRGEDPTRAFADAEDELERALELRPDWGALVGVLGYNAWARARWEWASGGDAARFFDRAASWFARAVELAPDHAVTRFNQALMHVVYADYLLDAGRADEAVVVIATARRACRRLAALAAGQALCVEAKLEVEAARAATARGAEPAAHLRRSLELAREGAQREPARCGSAAADAHRLLAAWRRRQGLAPRGHLEHGREAVEALLEINPDDSVALEASARLLLERARSAADPRERTAAARRALAAYERFLDASPSWAASSRPEIDEARALASGASADGTGAVTAGRPGTTTEPPAGQTPGAS